MENAFSLCCLTSNKKGGALPPTKTNRVGNDDKALLPWADDAPANTSGGNAVAGQGAAGRLRASSAEQRN